MLLLTGATGQVGSALLPRLLSDGEPVRCLVRDPRRLGPHRVRVQIALGDLTDPPSFRNAMRGVDTVVHLAASRRDQSGGSIEELNGIATWRMVQAAREAGVQRFVFFSALGASTHHRSRFFRAKAIAERAVVRSGMRCIVLCPSTVYSPGDRWLTLIERMSLLPFMPIPGDGRSVCQPIWAEDVADCAVAALRADGQLGAGPMEATVAPKDAKGAAARHEGGGAAGARYELAGPQTLTQDEMVRLALRSMGRRQPLLHLPTPLVSRGLRLLERLSGAGAFATWDEAELMQVPMIASKGAADAEALGVCPQRMGAVLGLA